MLSSVLPPPKFTAPSAPSLEEDVPSVVEAPRKNSHVPSYPNRKNFIPVNIEDFNDGGAYPEIHVVQYPLNMGKPGSKSNAVVAVDVDEKGQVRYDSIVRQGTNKNKIVQSTVNDLKEKEATENSLSLPTEEEEYAAMEKTKRALEELLNGKISASKPLTSAHTKEGDPTFIRYTPNPNAPGYNPSAQQRVIKMVEAQIDPMEPPKHPFKKVPRGPTEDPVPILHSPPRKLTVADQQAWKIPPAISNWKNAKGFIIPLDKRLAADGRGLQEITINNKFATLSESLYVAERKAAEDLRIRNQIRKKMAIAEKEDREKDLREMAAKARMERAGILGGKQSEPEERSYYEAPTQGRSVYDEPRNSSPLDDGSRDSDSDYGRDEGHIESRGNSRGRDNSGNDSDGSEEESYDDETEAQRRERIEREKLRLQRRKEREREMRLENMKGNMRKSKTEREDTRDISEKIALGLHKGSAKLSGESMFDSRLFNQSAGISGGFGNEDENNAFSKPLFDRGEASTIYRPKKGDADIYGDADSQIAKLSDTSRFRPDKGFKGAEGGVRSGGRDAPVQFERPGDRDDDDERGSSKRSRYE